METYNTHSNRNETQSTSVHTNKDEIEKWTSKSHSSIHVQTTQRTNHDPLNAYEIHTQYMLE